MYSIYYSVYVYMYIYMLEVLHKCLHFMVVIFVMPADMKNDSDVSASYGSLHQ